MKSPKAPGKTEKWQLAEADVNEFMAVAISSKKRLGLTKLVLDFDASGTLRSTAVINMDDIKLDSVAVRAFTTLLSGVHTLQAQGRLVVTKNSRAVFQIDKASFDGMWVPSWFVSSLVGVVGTRQAPGIDITEEFPLPYGISSVRIGAEKVEIVR